MKIINLIIGIIIISGFLFILFESLKQERPLMIWLINYFNLFLGILNIFLFFVY